MIHKMILLGMCVPVLMMLGCSGGSGIPVVAVKGKIKFAAGAAPAPVAIHFVPLETENSLPKIPGKAVIAEDGSFYVVTEQAGNGLIPGKYVVNIECWKQAPTMQAPGGVSHLPPSFKTPELIVKAGSAAMEFNIDVPATP
jgi:hypothetical protein